MTRLTEPYRVTETIHVAHIAPSAVISGHYVMATDKGNYFIRSVPSVVRAHLNTKGKVFLLITRLENTSFVEKILGFSEGEKIVSV